MTSQSQSQSDAGTSAEPQQHQQGTTVRHDGRPPDDSLLKSGDVIGPYTIREKVGEGGFAIVYLAEQTQPIARRVAIKMIKPGMDSRQIVARFRSELQALAMMEHPNIAKVLDAGTSDSGHAYFVMEYLPGEPITQYCDRHKLDTRHRLELFRQTCDAIQHAHQKGIIHRDIKPTNVLVSVKHDQPRVKVIDFGVAKALGQRLTDETLFTAHGQLIGTPEYMSPEQAEMSTLDIDTRSDIYSLGVLLYELLVGELPFDRQQLRSAAIAEIQRIIREVNPPKPSTRCSTMIEARLVDCAQHRHTDPSTLQRILRGDLDWITMKALEKDRSYRYSSASELSAEIDRHLRDEPVLAGPPSMMYRVRKFTRRHRFGTAFAATITLLVSAAVILVAVQRGRAIAYQTHLEELIPIIEMYTQIASDYAEQENVAASLTVYHDFQATARQVQSVDPEALAGLSTARINTIMKAIDATYYEDSAEIIAAKSQLRQLLSRLEQLQAEIPVDVETSLERLRAERIASAATEEDKP